MLTIDWADLYPCFSTVPDEACFYKCRAWLEAQRIGCFLRDVEVGPDGAITKATFSLWNEGFDPLL